MKHLSIIIIVVSLCVFLLSIGVYHKVPWSVLPIVASGICILCWLLFHLLCISEERDLLKEGNQYFIDTFQNIRNPISLIKTPLGAVYEGDCPEDIKKELAVALHHIKKENIGLIEVMGLAVLPARLKDEMAQLKTAILSRADLRSNEVLSKHADWVEEFLSKYESITEENIDGIIRKEIGLVFREVLMDAGVYKCTEEGREAFLRFIDTVNK